MSGPETNLKNTRPRPSAKDRDCDHSRDLYHWCAVCKNRVYKMCTAIFLLSSYIPQLH